jgi:pseudouridine-5'-phosphate glycosidase
MDFIFKPEVRLALDQGQPVVSLESTVIAHGLPAPSNLETARAMESAVRKAGATPATVALLQGRVHIGLEDHELTHLAGPHAVRKCSRRDLPIAVAGGEDGATTVAATMYLAARAGLRVFATGGIGGVHRGHPFDVSADLRELGRTPLCVVCAGAKAILDLPLTLEVLETQGVPVIGYRTDRFPAFYTRDAGLPVDTRCDTPGEVASIVRARDALGLEAGVLVTNPVPEPYELPAAEAETALAEALAEAEARDIGGSDVTPFLLSRVSKLTGAASLRANTALLVNNAELAAQVAVELAETGEAGS